MATRRSLRYTLDCLTTEGDFVRKLIFFWLYREHPQLSAATGWVFMACSTSQEVHLQIRWGTCPLFGSCEGLARPEVPWSVDRQTRSSWVASPFSRPHTARFFSLGLSEGPRIQGPTLYNSWTPGPNPNLLWADNPRTVRKRMPISAFRFELCVAGEGAILPKWESWKFNLLIALLNRTWNYLVSICV